MNTLLLNHSDVARLHDANTLFPAMRSAFIDYSEGRDIPARRFFSDLPGPGETMVLMPGLVKDIPAYTVKVNAKFSNLNPAIRGGVLLNDLHTGAPLAIMDSFELTAVRTGLAAAMATDQLARIDARRVAVIGAGVQGVHQLRYLCMLRQVESVKIYDVSMEQSRAFVKEMEVELDVDFDICSTLEHAISEVDIILIATWSNNPVLFADMICPGCHITTLGADGPNEAEIDANLIRDSVFICDDRDLAIEMGTVGGVGLGSGVIDAEIGEVFSGSHPGRATSDQVTIYGAVGLAFQDLVTAWQIFQTAQSGEHHQQFDFLG